MLELPRIPRYLPPSEYSADAAYLTLAATSCVPSTTEKLSTPSATTATTCPASGEATTPANDPPNRSHFAESASKDRTPGGLADVGKYASKCPFLDHAMSRKFAPGKLSTSLSE